MGDLLTQHDLFLYESVDLISCTTVLGALYGTVFALYCLCARSLYLQSQELEKRRQARLMLGFISLLLLGTTTVVAINSLVIQSAYIENADFPGGPFAVEHTYQNLGSINILDPICVTTDLFIAVLTMAIQVGQ